VKETCLIGVHFQWNAAGGADQAGSSGSIEATIFPQTAA
jgi:hypothetical protein